MSLECHTQNKTMLSVCNNLTGVGEDVNYLLHKEVHCFGNL